MTSIAHIDIARAIDPRSVVEAVSATRAATEEVIGEQVLAAGMVDIDFSLFFMLGLFLVFAVVMHYLVLKPLIASQEARYKGMGGARDDASTYELRAAQLRLDYEKRMTKARQDAVHLRDAIKKEAVASSQEKVAGMQAAVDAQIEGAKGELGRFAQVAKTEMEASAEALATDLSTKIIGGKA
jgi:F-type H+-transporting ATPase subunit b